MFAWQGLPGPLLLLLLLLALIRQISILPVAGISPGCGCTGKPRLGWHPAASGGRGQCVSPPVLAGDGSCPEGTQVSAEPPGMGHGPGPAEGTVSWLDADLRAKHWWC